MKEHYLFLFFIHGFFLEKNILENKKMGENILWSRRCFKIKMTLIKILNPMIMWGCIWLYVATQSYKYWDVVRFSNPGGGAHLCFMAFAFHFQILGQFSIFVKLSIQGVKWKLRYRRSQIWKIFGLVTKQKAHKIVKTCKKLWQKDIFFQTKHTECQMKA